MDDDKLTPTLNGDETEFYKQVADLLTAARKHAKKQMDNTIAVTYFEVGRMIVEREQQGQKRARYGTKFSRHRLLNLKKTIYQITFLMIFKKSRHCLLISV